MTTNRNTTRKTGLLSRSASRRTFVTGGAAALAASTLGLQTAGARSSRMDWTSTAMHLRRQGSIKLRATVWLGDNEFKAMEELGARFTENHPEVSIEYLNIVDGGPWGRDQLQRMIAGGDAPDLMMLNTGQFEAFGTRGALADLDERITADSFDLGAYFEPAIDGCKIDGKIHGLPKDISNHLVYINTDFFAEAGVDLPTNEWTWDDYRETAKALTRDSNGDGQIDHWGIGIQNAAWSWGSFVYSNGGAILNDERTEFLLGSEEAREALRTYYGILVDDNAAVPPGALPQVEGASQQFLGAAVGMNMAGPWFRPSLVEEPPFNWTLRLFPRPTAEGGPPTSVLYVDQWGMSSTSKNPDEAWELLKFLSGPEGQTIWSEIYGSRSITPIQELANSDAWLSYGGDEHREDNLTILSQLERTVAPPTNFGKGAQIENIWNDNFELVIVGQMDVDTAIDTIIESVDPVLQG